MQQPGAAAAALRASELPPAAQPPPQPSPQPLGGPASTCTICGCDLSGHRLFHIVSAAGRLPAAACGTERPPPAPLCHRAIGGFSATLLSRQLLTTRGHDQGADAVPTCAPLAPLGPCSATASARSMQPPTWCSTRGCPAASASSECKHVCPLQDTESATGRLQASQCCSVPSMHGASVGLCTAEVRAACLPRIPYCTS